ncbi:MAG: carboxypeptidase regulatory-like domain-containing protein [Bryobacteraceae bacterium]
MKYVLLFLCALLSAGCSKTEEEPAAKVAPPPEYYKVDPATAAALRGTVTFAGKKPPAEVISMNAEEACEKLHPEPVSNPTIITASDGKLTNVFVYVKTGLEGKKFEPSNKGVVLDQRGCMFVPRVIALRAGETLTVKNSDPVSHNIHPDPRNNREWNQQQSPGAPDLQRRFGFPEVMIPVKCNVHSWMRSYIGVMDHPYFAVTGDTGAFEWTALPPGEYTIAAWHETLGEQTEKITLAGGSQETVNFTFRLPPAGD